MLIPMDVTCLFFILGMQARFIKASVLSEISVLPYQVLEAKWGKKMLRIKENIPVPAT